MKPVKVKNRNGANYKDGDGQDQETDVGVFVLEGKKVKNSWAFFGGGGC